MSNAVITAWAVWLQQHIGAAMFTADHPGLPECAGAHGPDHPCDGKRGKHPCGKWSRDSTTDPAAITRALAGPPRNTAIDTRKSGLLVADEDRHGAFTDYAASIGGAVPETFTVTTRPGRKHFYFRQPAGSPFGNGTGTLPQGIDVRGHGYVIAPGSLHETGVIYTPVNPAVPVAPIPGWLAAALRPPSFSQPGRAPFRQPGSVHGRLRGIVAYVLDATAPAGPDSPGNRNQRLFWAACKVREMVAAGELDQDMATGLLAEAGESTGLGRGAVSATIASAMRGAGR
jgi:hypothetical protein